jgi:hypothetical protein
VLIGAGKGGSFVAVAPATVRRKTLRVTKTRERSLPAPIELAAIGIRDLAREKFRISCFGFVLIFDIRISDFSALLYIFF